METRVRTTLRLAFFLTLILVRASAQTASSSVYLDPSTCGLTIW